MTITNIREFGEGALSATSNALNAVGKFTVDFGIKAKSVTFFVLNKLGEYFALAGKELLNGSKILKDYTWTFLQFAGRNLEKGGHFALDQSYKAAILTKGLVLTYPQLFCGVGVGLGIGAIAVCGTYYLVK